MPKFSVIIPTYNRNKLVLQAINSVNRFANKNDVEIIVVDDSPVSRLNNFLNKEHYPNLRYFRNKDNRGPGFCRQFGLSKALGKYVIFMDDDDFYLTSIIFSKSNELLEKYSNLSMVGFNSYDYLEEQDKFTKSSSLNAIGYIDNKEYLKKFIVKYSKPKSTFTSVFRKKDLLASGALDVGMLNDTVIYLRALLGGDAYLCKEYIGAYRIHKKRITGNVSEQFILENLKEKKKISYRLPFNKFYKSKWLVEQTWISVAYLLDNNEQSNKLKLIDKWYFSQNMIVKYYYLFYRFKHRLKHYIRG